MKKMIILLALALASCSSSSRQDGPCDLNGDCASGYLCDSEGSCVKAEPVSIKSISLPEAVVGEEGYSQPMQAQDGISPFAWSLRREDEASKLAWLEIVPNTGELRARAGQAPTEPAQDLRLVVEVTDSSNHGQGQMAELPLTLNIVECRADVACYLPEAGVCQQGVYKCQSGVLSTDCTLSGPSTDAGHCGADCAACPAGTGPHGTAPTCRPAPPPWPNGWRRRGGAPPASRPIRGSAPSSALTGDSIASWKPMRIAALCAPGRLPFSRPG